MGNQQQDQTLVFSDIEKINSNQKLMVSYDQGETNELQMLQEQFEND